MLEKTGRRGDELMFQNARIIFKNFEGTPTKFNREGKRTFCVLLDPDVADMLVNDGWNVKALNPREEGDLPQPYLQVTVNFDSGRGPNIYMVPEGGKAKVRLTADTVGLLDTSEIVNVEFIMRPYHWESTTIAPYKGITAYLVSMYATIYQSPLDKKYSDYDDGTEEAN